MARRQPAGPAALAPTVICAIDQYLPTQERVVHDRLALRVLPPAARLAVRACRCAPVRALAERACERRAPGLWAGTLCRRRYGDEKVAQAVAEGIGQVVVLGAGLDTRACRLVVPAGVPAFEVDLPGGAVRKRLRLKRALGRVPVGLRLVAVDAEAPSLAAALDAAGYSPGRTALFVWEPSGRGALRDAAEAQVRAVLGALSAAAPGSRLLFTYPLRQDRRRADRGGETAPEASEASRPRRRAGPEPGLPAGRVGALLGEYGWRVCEQAAGPGLAERYLRAAGREGVQVPQGEASVYAVKR
ncbi:class I SAM-dependent methyltransferase [Nocardiopsis chromatogenes]|uniref:class I SAM-dependent methyltransferase n=1 Tax=Nocardiopsis chromatogenes TaxID=280239 RepID=UPI000347B5E2|nr:SAM-dependent methyltransferase [Nocardiopsis chromatogenes]